MKFEFHHIDFGVFAKDVLAGAQIRELPAQNQMSITKLAGNE